MMALIPAFLFETFAIACEEITREQTSAYICNSSSGTLSIEFYYFRDLGDAQGGGIYDTVRDCCLRDSTFANCTATDFSWGEVAVLFGQRRRM
jgi:hypothetical protein